MLRFRSVGEQDEKLIIDWLKKREEVIWIGNCDGRWSLIITIHTKNLKDTVIFVEDLTKRFGEEFQEKQLYTRCKKGRFAAHSFS